MLANWRMVPVLADSAAMALTLLERAQRTSNKFPIVLLDTQMPEIDGFSLVEKIKSNTGLAGATILMLSADRHLADAARYRDLGVTVFLTKPVGQSDLLDAILTVLGLKVIEERLIDVPIVIPQKHAGPTLNILLCEDNPVNQKLAIRLLEKAGHRVTLADNGRAGLLAWENSDNQSFDLILMDIQMPEMDGMEATAAIREQEKTSGKHIPIIAMTANAMRGDKERYIDGGMDGYISKPINAPGLFAEIKRCLTGFDQDDRIIPLAPDATERAEHFDRASLLERVEGDQELLAEMVQLFVDDAPRLLDAMNLALQQGDMTALERLAHSLKGAASNLSASVTMSAASQLEKEANRGNAEASKACFSNLENALLQLLPVLSDLCHGVSK